MRKGFVAHLSMFLFLCLTVFPVSAATSTVSSSIAVSAGGTGYSDVGNPATNLTIPTGTGGTTIQYDKYNVKLKSFQFSGYPKDEKPTSSVRFNFRLVTSSSHTNIGSVIYLYNLNNSNSAWIWDGHGYSGEVVAMKSNITNWSSSVCVVYCDWYLFMS